ncbi:hypothetical protein ACFYNM_39335 [Streptomyces spororaveus]|uniref:hypothetical protein n=1 Tax=Streptomyces spororaveus TaxID=284039 RepID=UPI0036845519
MSVRITNQGTQTVTFHWDSDDDPRGWLFKAISGAAPLEDALQAIADPMEFGNTDRIADANEAKRRLRSVLSLIKTLNDRADVLTVALRDTYDLSWSDLQEVIDPDNPHKRSTARRRYETGRDRIGLSPAPAVHLLPGGFTAGQRVRVTSVPGRLSTDYIGCEGVIQEFNKVEDSYILTGLTGRPEREQVLGIPGFQAAHIEPLDD